MVMLFAHSRYYSVDLNIVSLSYILYYIRYTKSRIFTVSLSTKEFKVLPF